MKITKKLITVMLSITSLSANAAQTCKATIEATTPSSRFIINTADNTVTDKTTGLTWMRCSLGQTGSDCSGGSISNYTWAGALNEVANNHSGWRLPNIKELASIIERKCNNPAINIDVFPNTPSNTYWSSSPNASNESSAWVVDSGSYSYSDNKGSNNYVRLVRGG